MAGGASAQTVIKEPGNHASYGVEIEPHLSLGYEHGPRFSKSERGFGPGVRFSIPVVENGFVSTINNSVAISFGIDWIHFQGFGNETYDEFVLPVTMQWNFWVTDNWSFFGEPGIAIDVRVNRDTEIFPAGYGGARWHMTDNINLVFRLGYPTSASVGISFFL